MRISQFFENRLGANLSNSRWSWGAFNPKTNQLFLRVWEDQLRTIDGVERILILDNDWRGQSNGYPERKKHVESLRNGAQGYGVLCVAKNNGAGTRKIENFDQNSLLKFGGLIEEENRVFARIVDRVPVNDVANKKTAYSTIVPDLKALLRDTSKETLANARLGQGAFRSKVLSFWGNRCCVTGSTTLDAIRASHIKPWRDCTNSERLDPCNGLPLIATLDALFDAGLISFSRNGVLITASKLGREEVKRLCLQHLRLSRTPDTRVAEYLEYHREHVFVRN